MVEMIDKWLRAARTQRRLMAAHIGYLVEQVRKMGPIFVPVTIHSIIGSEDIIDAMDLRAFGVGPRT